METEEVLGAILQDFLKEINYETKENPAETIENNQNVELKILNCNKSRTTGDISKIEKDDIRKSPEKIKKSLKRCANICDLCKRAFSSEYNLRIHMMKHNGEFRFECSDCGKKFRQRNKMEMHRITHTKEKPFVCDICGKGYRFRDYLAVHRRLHESPETKPYKCKFCSEHFHSLHLRRVHQQTKHPAKEMYICPVALCGKAFQLHCQFLSHMKRHTDKREFRCNHCHKSFFSRANLESHRLTHTDFKPYPCEFCSAAFQRKSNMKQHVKIHLNAKTYICNICQRCFAQKAGLSNHIKWHS